jgi:hypothetical protein
LKPGISRQILPSQVTYVKVGGFTLLPGAQEEQKHRRDANENFLTLAIPRLFQEFPSKNGFPYGSTDETCMTRMTRTDYLVSKTVGHLGKLDRLIPRRDQQDIVPSLVGSDQKRQDSVPHGKFSPQWIANDKCYSFHKRVTNDLIPT